uniref:Major facilitator superfamily (MFS) profile domain-containing protein n=1 Tax=Globodera rostochiensis TaxID=31243 RepID=A0A914IA95_GLORO
MIDLYDLTEISTSARLKMAIVAIMPELPLPKEQIRKPSDENFGRRLRIPLLNPDHFRFVVMALAMLCMTSVSANSLLFNFTVICMDRDANFTANQRGVLIAGTAIGGILAIGPVPYAIAMFGLRYVFGVFGLLSGLVTLLQPVMFFAGGGFNAILATRIVQGFTLMPAMPAMSQITHNWANAANRENALFLMVLSLYMQLSVILTMPTAGALCESAWRWPSAYYLLGSLSLVMFSLFLFIYRNSPAKSPFVSARELSEFRRPPAGGIRRRQRVPYAQMCRDPAFWACCCAGLSFGTAYWLFAQFGPTYMNKVLNYKADSAGIFVAVPYFFAMFAKMLVPLADRVPRLSLRVRIVWIPCVCQLVNIVCYVLLALWPASSPFLAQVCFGVILCANGAGFVAVANNCQVIAQQHAHFLLALFALINYVITLVQPLIISRMAGSNAAKEWSRLFFAYAFILCLLNVAFALGARTRPRQWTKMAEENGGVTDGGEKPTATEIVARF